jgi:hypothetical protein
MIYIYKFVNGEDQRVFKIDTQNEQEALVEYLKSINAKMEGFQFLGELSGVVYRMSFKMMVNGETNEYYLVQS